MKMRVWPARALAAAILASSLPAAATPVAKRDLSEDEKLDYSVAESEAIVDGTILEVVDALVPNPVSHSLGPYRYLLVQPKRWLKGSLPKGSLPLKPIAVGFSDAESPIFRDVRGWAASETDELVLFVRRVSSSDPPATPAVKSNLPKIEWVVEDSPYQYERGVLRVRPGDDLAVQQKMDDMAKARSLESLVSRSTLTFLGTPLGEGACRVAGRENTCTRVRIDRLLVGSTMSSEVLLYGLFNDPLPASQSLFFVKETPDESYEVLSFRAGVMPVVNGKVAAIGKPLNDVVGRIKIVARASHGPGD